MSNKYSYTLSNAMRFFVYMDKLLDLYNNTEGISQNIVVISLDDFKAHGIKSPFTLQNRWGEALKYIADNFHQEVTINNTFLSKLLRYKQDDYKMLKFITRCSVHIDRIEISFKISKATFDPVIKMVKPKEKPSTVEERIMADGGKIPLEETSFRIKIEKFLLDTTTNSLTMDKLKISDGDRNWFNNLMRALSGDIEYYNDIQNNTLIIVKRNKG